MLNVGKLNLKTSKAADFKIPYRNTILEVAHPGVRLGILEVSREPDDRQKMVNLLGREYSGLRLDFATASRKKGCFVVSDQELGKRYWRTPDEALAYGSNLMTTCMEMPFQAELTVQVVGEGRYGTGDCHGRVRPDLLPLFGSHGEAIQFRMLASKWLAKGTVAAGGQDQAADLILPQSCFKSSRKPPLGAHLWQTTWGSVFLSKKRRVRVSYQFLQWFSFEAIMQDAGEHVEAEIARLVEASQSPKAMVDLLSPETDAEFTFMQVIKADVHDQLRSHPWVVNGLARMLRQRWLHLATGASLFADGFMGIPDESLPDEWIASSDISEGPVIAFRYPIRSWADIQLLEVRFDESVPPGAVAMNARTAETMAGDYDGDYFNFMPAVEFPAMAAEIREWKGRAKPVIPKASKRRVSEWERFSEVAYNSMVCPLGWVTNLITKANAAGNLEAAGLLAAESQISVDGLKFDVKQDWKLLRSMQKSLPALGWLKALGDREVFLSKPLTGTTSDTIGRLVGYVSPNWVSPQLLARPLEEYQYLVPKTESVLYRQYAAEAYRRYAQKVSGIMELDDEGRKQGFKHLMKDVRKWADSLNEPEEIFKALWQLAHRKHSDEQAPSTGSIVFHAFPGLVCDRLKSPAAAPEVVSIVGLQYHGWRDSLSQLMGIVDKLVVEETVLKGQIRSLAYLAGKALGIVSSETPVMPGIYERRLLWNGSGAVYASAP